MLDDPSSARRLSTVLGRIRKELDLSQAAVAKAAGIDQSRISRIEKGEVTNPTDIEKVMDALTALGATEVSAYREFANRNWVHIEPPSFWNPQRGGLEDAEETLGKIEAFLADEKHPWPLRRALEGHKAALLRGATFLNRTSHNLAFIGDIGVGKSTALAFAFDLLVPPSPSGTAMDRPILETGAGGTTICEVHTRRGPNYGLSIQPMPDKELRDLVADFCAAKWIALTNEDNAAREFAAVSREGERAIRNMSGLTRKAQRDGSKTTYLDPVRDLIRDSGTEEEFRTRVFELMRLGERTRRDLWFEPSLSALPMEWLARAFRDINNGRVPDVSLPKTIDVLIPDFGHEFGELDVTVIDTKGVDDVAVREDLDVRLRDPRTAVVFCCKFNDAPGVSSKTLLQHMRQTFTEPLTAGKVSILALPHPGDARAMKDDMGETATTDEEGYSFKAMQVENYLRSSDLPGIPVNFFNVQSDSPSEVRRLLLNQLSEMRGAAAAQLAELSAAVDEILSNHKAQSMVFAVQEVAARLLTFLESFSTLGARERHAYEEAMSTIRNVRYASTLWASARRNGEYARLNLMHQIGVGAARDAAARTARWFASLDDHLVTMKKDKGLKMASKTIDQINKSAATSRVAFLEAVQRAGTEVYQVPLSRSRVWSECANDWGTGPGYKARVAQRLEDWFEKRSDLKDCLEEVVRRLWETTVMAPLLRLADQDAPAPDATAPTNVVQFPNRG